MNKLFISLMFVVLCIITVIGCGAPAQTPQTISKAPAPVSATPTATLSLAKPQYGGTLKIITRTWPAVQDAPFLARGVGTIWFPMFECCFDMDASLQRLPWLAESWDIAADGKNITLHLRKGVKFHDGTDFNANAVKYYLTQVAPLSSALKKITSCDILDENTIRLNFTKYDGLIMSQLGPNGYLGMIVSPTALQAPTTDETKAKVHLVGTGSFKFLAWQRDVYARFEKFDGYWQKEKPYLDAIEFRLMADPVSALMSFKKGDAQMLADVAAKDARDLQTMGYNILQGAIPNGPALYPDSANPDSPFADKRVREAVEYAINKKSLGELTWASGFFDPISQCAKNGGRFFVPELKPRDFDPGKAKQLLASAGYPNGFKTKLIAKTTDDKELLTAIQTFLKEVGIDATMDIADAARYQDVATKSGWKNGLVFGSFPADINSYNTNFGLGTPENQGNRSVLRPPGWYDKLDAGFAEPDDAKLTAMTKEMVKIIYDEVMCIPFGVKPTLAVADKSVHDIRWGDAWAYGFWTPANTWLSK